MDETIAVPFPYFLSSYSFLTHFSQIKRADFFMILDLKSFICIFFIIFLFNKMVLLRKFRFYLIFCIVVGLLWHGIVRFFVMMFYWTKHI